MMREKALALKGDAVAFLGILILPEGMAGSEPVDRFLPFKASNRFLHRADRHFLLSNAPHANTGECLDDQKQEEDRGDNPVPPRHHPVSAVLQLQLGRNGGDADNTPSCRLGHVHSAASCRSWAGKAPAILATEVDLRKHLHIPTVGELWSPDWGPSLCLSRGCDDHSGRRL